MRHRTMIKGRLGTKTPKPKKEQKEPGINEKMAGAALAKVSAILSLLGPQWDKGQNSAVLTLLYDAYYQFHDAGLDEEPGFPLNAGEEED